MYYKKYGRVSNILNIKVRKKYTSKMFSFLKKPIKRTKKLNKLRLYIS